MGMISAKETAVTDDKIVNRPKAKITPKALVQWRKGMNLSTPQMAAFCATATPRTVRRWEDGKQDIPPYVDLLHELCGQSDEMKRWLVNRALAEWKRRCDENQGADEDWTDPR
jgi:DNA-binding transcriptional regulator YiaG